MTFCARVVPRLLLVALVATGCGSSIAGDSLAIPTPQLPPSDGLLGNPELQALVDLQTARDGAALQERLSSSESAIRARAALALASVQDPTAFDPLVERLTDADPDVRRNAAFALGQLALDDGGLVLLRALSAESDQDVRARLIDALGKRGGLDVIAELLTMSRPNEEPAHTLALSRAALREVRPPGVIEVLVERLNHPNPEVRARSAYYFGRAGSPSAWSPFAPQVRAVLDAYPVTEASAMDLLAGFGRLGEVEEDAGRISRWMIDATDWRTRHNAARAVMSPRWLESPSIQEALLVALDDASEHVRVAAAGSIGLLIWSSEEHLERARGWIQGPAENWRVQAIFAPILAALGSGDLVLAWTTRMADYHPVATARGIQALGAVDTSEAIELFFDLADHPDPLVRAAAISTLAQRRARGVVGDEPIERFYELFARALEDPENLPVARAAVALSHPDFAALGAESALERAFLDRRAQGDANVLVPILESSGSSSLPLLREVVEEDGLLLREAAARALDRLTGEQVPLGGGEVSFPRRTIDWPALEALGTSPRIRIETDQGSMTLRLYPEQAPLSVQNFVEQVTRGEHDGTRFHRVVSNFVAQAGDFGLGDGGGTTGYRIRSEFTQLPFQRGVIAMASAGKDTEGSQYYLTHSMQPHLEGGYTSFGWIEDGAAVLDRIQQGDQVLRMTLLD